MPIHNQTYSRLTVAGLILFISSFFLSSCSPISGLESPVKSVPGVARVLIGDITFYPQEKYQCGPASMAMMLSWSGMDIDPEELKPEIYTPAREGGLQSALVAAARRHGRIAYPVKGMDELFAEINAGIPVLVLLNLSFSWYPRWHYAVVVGYDWNQKIVYLHSGTRKYEELSFRVFNNTWARSDYWGLLVLPPSRIPVTADTLTWLDAAVGLELAEQWQAAEIAFSRATERWPQSYGSWVGLGNSRFTLDDLDGAFLAFEKAILTDPESGIAYNNLAQVLAAMKRYEEALAAARQAIRLGEPFPEKFRNTLAEIKSEMKEKKESP